MYGACFPIGLRHSTGWRRTQTPLQCSTPPCSPIAAESRHSNIFCPWYSNAIGGETLWARAFECAFGSVKCSDTSSRLGFSPVGANGGIPGLGRRAVGHWAGTEPFFMAFLLLGSLLVLCVWKSANRDAFEWSALPKWHCVGASSEIYAVLPSRCMYSTGCCVSIILYGDNRHL